LAELASGKGDHSSPEDQTAELQATLGDAGRAYLEPDVNTVVVSYV
jgi:hypothetical protein